MALPVIVAQEGIADRLVELLSEYAQELTIGPAYEKTSELGPVVTEAHRQFVLRWIEKGIEEGAKLVLDGRQATVDGYEKGFYLGPTIFDHVTPAMTIGDQEVFGPVVCVKRVRDFEEGLALMNAQSFRQRVGHLHAKRLLQPRIRPADARGHGRDQRRHPGAGRAVSRSPATKTPSSATCTCWARTASASTPRPRPSRPPGSTRKKS